ncbi:hypothetical protein CWI85_25030 [Streptomyces albidoflavus]|nr:hypothetical protein CWI85_25030 [Streptomyces albidoflavus]
MSPEESVLLGELTRRYNERVGKGEEVSDELEFLRDLTAECLEQAGVVLPAFSAWVEKNSRRRITWRRRGARNVERGLVKRFARAFGSLEAALAAGEFVNLSLVRAYQDWFGADKANGADMPSFFGVAKSVGGKHVKALLLMSMHARSVRIGSEILLLLRQGHHEGAASRARTLYELTIKMVLICSEGDQAGWELAERYYVSAQLESYSKRELLSDSVQGAQADLRDVALARWGDRLFSGQHNWAEPAVRVAGRGNVTFRQMEEAVDAERLRHMYEECNHAVHVGALKLIQSTDFRRSYLHSCRGEIDIAATGRIGQATSFYLEVGTMEAAQRLTSYLHEWDWLFATAEFCRKIDEANRDFFRVCEGSQSG